eukprot:6311797-Pyramimonas_sp.AAC.1
MGEVAALKAQLAEKVKHYENKLATLTVIKGAWLDSCSAKEANADLELGGLRCGCFGFACEFRGRCQECAQFIVKIGNSYRIVDPIWTNLLLPHGAGGNRGTEGGVCGAVKLQGYAGS